MRKIFLLIAVFSLSHAIVLNAHQSISGSLFWLKNQTSTVTDIKVYTVFSSAEPIQPDLNGYLEEIRNDTLFVKILYREHLTAGSGSSVSRNDTFTNIQLPPSINYLNVSGNMIKVNAAGDITDTLWNETDSTFILHPVSINDISKNSPTIRVYPNPAHHALHFDKNLDYDRVQVYNSIGQQVAVYQKNSARSIDISALSNGIYVIKLLDKNTEIIGRARFLKTN